jgi:ZIP family zinc transporter
MTLAGGNVGASIGLTFASGACTMLGAAVVFFPKLVKLASRRVLAGALGFSSGVMIYISLVDIFERSYTAFATSGMNDSQAYGFATLCFFMGVLVMKVSFVTTKPISCPSFRCFVLSFLFGRRFDDRSLKQSCIA